MYCLSVFCFVCLSMDKKKKINKISDLSIFHMLNSCSYDTKWMEDTFTMHICGKCHNQLYSVYEFIEMCRKNSSLLQGYVALLKHGSNDIAQPTDRSEDREMVKMEVVIDLDTVENKLEDDINVNMISANDTIADSVINLSLKNELDVDMPFLDASMEIKHESVILKSDIDNESNHVLDKMMEFNAETASKQDLMFQSVVSNNSEIVDKRDLETEKYRTFGFVNEQIQTASETANICKHIKIEHIRDQNEILVTNVLDEDHNIKTQFSSNSAAIYVNNIIENNTVRSRRINKVNLQNHTVPIDKITRNAIQRRENDQNFRIKPPGFSNGNKIPKVCLSRNGTDIPLAQDQPKELSVYTGSSYCLNQTICSAKNKLNSLSSSTGFGLNNKMSSVLTNNPIKRTEFNRKVKKTKQIPASCSTDKMFYIKLPTLSFQPVPNIPVMDTVPSFNNTVVKNVDNSIKNSQTIAATNTRVKVNKKTEMEPPHKCDICQKTYDTYVELRFHLVTHSGMKTLALKEDQRTQMGVGRNKKENYETMFIKHMIRTGSL